MKEDLQHALAHCRAWLFLGWWDVKQRYQRSTLGPWWITLSTSIFIMLMSQIFSKLFAQNFSSYLLFFTTGYLFWAFCSMSIAEATELFKVHSSFIKQIKLPFHFYVFKLLTRNIVIFAHNFLVYFLLLGFLRVNPGWKSLFVLPGLLLLLANLYWVTLLVAILSARYRDLVPIVSSLLQMLFFVTPISWMPHLLHESLLVRLNPLVYWLELVRQPLLGSYAAAQAWGISFLSVVWGISGSLFLFHRVRTQIPFWVD
jgi:lipopolysaccharide transport system permease protein